MGRYWAEETSPNPEFTGFENFSDLLVRVRQSTQACPRVHTPSPHPVPRLASSHPHWGFHLTLQSHSLHLSPVQSKITALFSADYLDIWHTHSPSVHSTSSSSLPLSHIRNRNGNSHAKNILTYRHSSVRDFSCLIKRDENISQKYEGHYIQVITPSLPPKLFNETFLQ